MKTVCVTGATAGIGEATAKLFAKKGYRLVITGRREKRLHELKASLMDLGALDCAALSFDVRDEQSCIKAFDSLTFDRIDILVNNAGLARGKESIVDGDSADWDEMIDTNVKGLLYVTRRVLPLMPRDGKGHIINISSIAGLESYPGGNVYCASKHAVEGLANGMRIDLLKERIRVTNINPGLVETEFSVVRFKGDQEKADSVYNEIAPLTGEDIAECIYWTAERPVHVNINSMVVMPSCQASSVFLERGHGV